MKLHHVTAALAASATLWATSPALAAADSGSTVQCADSISTVLAAGYAQACQGSLQGSLGASGITSATFGGRSVTLSGTTLDGSGRFGADPGGLLWGELQLSEAQTSTFVLGLQGGGTYSLYLLRGGSAGLTALEFDTYGLTRGWAGLAAPQLD